MIAITDLLFNNKYKTKLGDNYELEYTIAFNTFSKRSYFKTYLSVFAKLIDTSSIGI